MNNQHTSLKIAVQCPLNNYPARTQLTNNTTGFLILLSQQLLPTPKNWALLPPL